jgi:hypothetical protein
MIWNLVYMLVEVRIEHAWEVPKRKGPRYKKMTDKESSILKSFFSTTFSIYIQEHLSCIILNSKCK